jgi:hypothetical protein
MSDLQELQKNVSELEKKYQEKVTDLQTANTIVVKEEHALLLCLQELTPLQNSYLTNVIKILQSQNETLREENLLLRGTKLPTVSEDEDDTELEKEDDTELEKEDDTELEKEDDTELEKEDDTELEDNLPAPETVRFTRTSKKRI